MKHLPGLDKLSPSEIRVLCEELLYTMEYEQRQKIMARHPMIYLTVYGKTDTMIEAIKQVFVQEAQKK